MSDTPKPCSRCHDEAAGPGGILGPRCEAALAARTLDDMYGPSAGDPE